VLVAEGDEIKPRQVVAILEAMKLEINVEAPDGGKVEKLLVQPGEIINAGGHIALIKRS
jgi:urea carboxylase